MDHPADDRGPSLRAFAIVITVLTMIALAFRLWSRSFCATSYPTSKARFWWDDWFALATGIFVLSQLAVTFVMIDQAGTGRHMWTLNSVEIALFVKLLFAAEQLFGISLCLSRASALLFFQRLFPRSTNSTWFQTSLWTIFGLNIVWWLGTIFGSVFNCTPIQKAWDISLSGKCGPTLTLCFAAAVPSVLIDFLILLLPLPKIRRLHISFLRKFGLSIVLMLGSLVIITSIGRIVTVSIIADKLAPDLTYEAVPFLYWITAEPAISVICIFLPSMIPISRYLQCKYFGPFGHKITSFVNLRNFSTAQADTSNKSTSGDFSQGCQFYGHRPVGGSSILQTSELVEIDSRISEDSGQKVLVSSPLGDRNDTRSRNYERS
ncbi:hypothetical protein F5Y19DRAFT_477873 [Xylariaceae sp. FL1651]|nr:hypothetical protein F5Y19DRAFT_477873 [Xylariaceae sp. FL1651]